MPIHLASPTLLYVCPDTTVYCIYQITGSKRLLARRQWLGGSVVLLVGSQCWKRRSASSMPCASKWRVCRFPPPLSPIYVYVCMHMHICICIYTYVHTSDELPAVRVQVARVQVAYIYTYIYIYVYIARDRDRDRER